MNQMFASEKNITVIDKVKSIAMVTLTPNSRSRSIPRDRATDRPRTTMMTITAVIRRIGTSTPFTLGRFRYYHGARVANADGSVEYRILDARSGSAVILDHEIHPDATADKLSRAFPRDSWFEIYDYGVGDEVVWPYSVSVILQRPGQYRVTAPVPVKVALPDGSKVTLATPEKEP